MSTSKTERPGLRGRLDRAQSAIWENTSYRHALQLHHAANNTFDKLQEIAGSSKIRDAGHLITAMIMLYGEEMKTVGISSGFGDAKGGISPHFMHFCINRLPEGPSSTPLKAMFADALRYWRIRNPTKAVLPLCSCTGEPVVSAARPR